MRSSFFSADRRMLGALTSNAWKLVLCAIGLTILPPGDAFAQSDTSAEIRTRLPEVRRYLEGGEGTIRFSGVVLVGIGDDVVYEGAYGFADADLQIPVRTYQIFRIGSLTKPITASAVLAAVEQGRLSLDDPLARYLDGCPESWRPVTIRQVLSHTSGIEDHFGDLESVPVEQTAAELERVLATLSPDEPLLAPAGAEYAYSNFNYVLLGIILEEVMGIPWASALDQLVFEPLGLTTMGYDDVYALIPGRVRGYTRNDVGELRNIEYDDHAAYAAGGLLSSVRDLFEWSRGMMSGKLFRMELVEESFTPVRGNYGLGWQIRQFFDRDIYNHTGGIDGFSSHIAHYPQESLTIIVLSNVANDSAILRACDVASILFDWHVPDHSAAESRTPQQRCGLER